MTYIIVDPDQTVKEALVFILDSYGLLFFKGSFTNSQEAVDNICKQSPDLVFIKMGTPRLNVVKLIIEIKEKAPLTKVILMSSHPEDGVEAFEYKANGLLLMPFNEEKVWQMMLAIMIR